MIYLKLSLNLIVPVLINIMRKHIKKKIVKNRPAKCVVCSKILTTTDMCYSNNIEKCWGCDKLGVQTQLF